MLKKDKPVFTKLYQDIITHELYNKKYFSNYDEFILFCNKDYTNITGLELLVKMPELEFRKIIESKLCEYHLTHDDIGEPNKPITYFKYTYRRN